MKKTSVAQEASYWEGKVTGFAEGILAGCTYEARKILELWGTKRFGGEDLDAISELHGISDLAKLEAVILRLPEITSWQDLLRLLRRRTRRRKRTL